MRITTLARLLPHPETVCAGPGGFLYTGIAIGTPHGRGPVVQVDPRDGQARWFADPGGRVLGLCPVGDGLAGCDVARAELVRISAAGAVTSRISTADGRQLQRPNGCVADAAGGIWFTDSGTATAGEPTGSICYAGPDDAGCHIAADALVYPNGIGLSPDGHTLYASLTRDNALVAFEVLAPGRLAGRRLVTSDLATGPDGLSVGPDGCCYVAVTRSSRIVRVTPDGHTRTLLEAPELLRMPSHAAWHDGRILVPSLFGDTITALDPG